MSIYSKCIVPKITNSYALEGECASVLASRANWQCFQVNLDSEGWVWQVLHHLQVLVGISSIIQKWPISKSKGVGSLLEDFLTTKDDILPNFCLLVVPPHYI